MFKATPPPDAGPDNSLTGLQRHTLDLALLELRHQPMLKLRAFGAGVLTGMALVIGAEVGYQLADNAAAPTLVEAAGAALPEQRTATQ